MPIIRAAAIGLFSAIGIGLLGNNNGAIHLIKTTTWNDIHFFDWIIINNLIKSLKRELKSKGYNHLPQYKRSKTPRMSSMVLEQLTCPTKIPSTALAMPTSSAIPPYWWKRTNSRLDPCLRWEQTTAIGRIRSESNASASKSRHRLQISPSSCIQNSIILN